jgi:NADP-dependent 3-hydroxy acid dehydrogenase YdfG
MAGRSHARISSPAPRTASAPKWPSSWHGTQQSLQLTLAARSLDNLQAVADQCQAHGAQLLAVPTDVSDEAACRALVAQSVQQFGGLDVLVNNAGVSAHALFEEVSAEHLAWYEQLMRTNFWGSVWCTHAALPHLKASHGSIVAVSSLAGLVGVPGRTAYSASKFARPAFSKRCAPS